MTFSEPQKRISSATDVDSFKSSQPYADIISLLDKYSSTVQEHLLPPNEDELAASSKALVALCRKLSALIDETPPLEGPRRFGNVAVRDWHDQMEAQTVSLLTEAFPKIDTNAIVELQYYLHGGMGSKQRLDFGTGHELSFMAFVGGLQKLGLLEKDLPAPDVLFIFETYFGLVRKLITTYSLEPAGSHGVWGLDDHSHLPYILGSAQKVARTVTASTLLVPTKYDKECPPASVMNPRIVQEQKTSNLYFSAIAFIYDLKTGPFYEHSPILYDISGIATWAKIHSGMIKMYIAEVLGKFPVVQHFYFGSELYPWKDTEGNDMPYSKVQDEEPAKPKLPPGFKAKNEPQTTPHARMPLMGPRGMPMETVERLAHRDGQRAAMEKRAGTGGAAATTAPGPTRAPGSGIPTKAPGADAPGMAPTKAPWAK
ncbi:Serine/threonine-protein phosphatase 2A activator 1 [Yarrowia sp. C11]|nr:Serine/threonine-protein phosphatase 2A activator 1 [Yarrowia sp. E02]KAG5371592.1 Serine/threonine-protein phosphatase 2A activator 1 [Yarrowia sp. C11]